MHLFWPYLLNDSQIIRLTIHFSKFLLCVMLIGGDGPFSQDCDDAFNGHQHRKSSKVFDICIFKKIYVHL